MKKLGNAMLIGLVMGIFIAAKPAGAHQLKTDGSIGVVLHMSPDDDPFVGESTAFFFEFKDKTNKFKPQECDCSFVISKENKEIFTQELFQDNTNPSLTSASVSYVFPEKNVYEIIVIGKPKAGSIFQPFSLTYAIRVSRTSNGQSTVPTYGNTPWFKQYAKQIIIVVLLVFFGTLAIVNRSPRSKSK